MLDSNEMDWVSLVVNFITLERYNTLQERQNLISALLPTLNGLKTVALVNWNSQVGLNYYPEL